MSKGTAMTESVLPKGLYLVVNNVTVEGEIDMRFREVRANFCWNERPMDLKHAFARDLHSRQFGKYSITVYDMHFDLVTSEVVMKLGFNLVINSKHQVREMLEPVLGNYVDESDVIPRSIWWKLFVWPFSRD